MEGLLSFLLFGVFFYLMMRFGCGAHMVHGGHEGHGSEGHAGHSTQQSSAKDPVCGMDVASGEGYSKMYEGREHRFCSRKCLDKFEAEPQRYLS
jgi:YHS domain-containing protein